MKTQREHELEQEVYKLLLALIEIEGITNKVSYDEDDALTDFGPPAVIGRVKAAAFIARAVCSLKPVNV
jgi:hypothetical protein